MTVSLSIKIEQLSRDTRGKCIPILKPANSLAKGRDVFSKINAVSFKVQTLY